MGSKPFADIRYGEEDSISPKHKAQRANSGIYSPYIPWSTLEVSSEMKPKWVC